MINLVKLPSNIVKFMPLHQQAIVKEHYNQYKSIVERLDKEIQSIPNIPQQPLHNQGGLHDRYLVYAHFFFGSYDWYILDWDRENDILFGYAILAGDAEMSELGIVALSELTHYPLVELDFYWSKCTLAEALHNRYPSYFAEPFTPKVRQKDWRTKVKAKYCITNKRKKKHARRRKMGYT